MIEISEEKLGPMQAFAASVRTWVEDTGADVFEGLDLSSLKMDQAYVRTTTSYNNVSIYAVSDDCYKCPFERVRSLQVPSDVLAVDTARRFTWRILQNVTDTYVTNKNKTGLVCELRPIVGEFGVYDLDTDTCEIITAKEPVNIYLPLVLLALLLGGAALAYSGAKLLASLICRRRKYCAEQASEISRRQRLQALDTFRGIAIVAMIFVNDGAGGYWFLQHATWDGLAVGDLVFPSFVWIMGVCIPLTIKSTFSKSIPRYKTFLNILRRSMILIALGVSLGTVWGACLNTLRVFGVLQRFGVAYFVAATTCLYTTKKYYSQPRGLFGVAFKDVYVLIPQWVLAIVLAAAHTFITFSISKPGCPAGYLGPGGKHYNFLYENCTGGISAYVDTFVMGSQHVYQNPQARAVYGAQPFDPEGILGCLTTIVQVFLGAQAGSIVVQYASWRARVWRWLSWSLVLGLMGAILCGFSKDKGIIPVNKNLWSLSFVLVTSSLSFALLAAVYALTDACRPSLWSGAPFAACGRNAILLYAGHTLCFRTLPFHFELGVNQMRTHTVQLAENAWGTMLWVVIAVYLDKNKIYLSI